MHSLLHLQALWSMELHLKSLPLWGYPAGVDSFVLGMGPVVLGVVHLVAVAFEAFLDVVVAPGIVLGLEAERIANGV